MREQLEIVVLAHINNSKKKIIMKKKFAKQVLETIRKWDAKNIGSETRSKLLTNIITLKKIAVEIDETIKTLQESMTDEEKKAAVIVQNLQKKVAEDKDYKMTDNEMEAVTTVKNWESVANKSLSEVLNLEVEIKKLTSEEFDIIAEHNEMSMGMYEELNELLVG